MEADWEDDLSTECVRAAIEGRTCLLNRPGAEDVTAAVQTCAPSPPGMMHLQHGAVAVSDCGHHVAQEPGKCRLGLTGPCRHHLSQFLSAPY